MEEQRAVAEWRARDFAERHRLPYLETSAATGQNVSRAIDTLLDRVMLRMETAVGQAALPGRRGRPRDPTDDVPVTSSDHIGANCHGC